MESEGRTIFTTFLNSGLHGAVWPKDVYSVIGFTEFCNNPLQLTCVAVIKNNSDCHSEQNAISSLRQKLRQRCLPSQTLRWFINYSPCRNCSDEIIQFIQEARTFGVVITIKMTFSFLYKIRRPSCEELSHPHIQCISPWDHQKNVEGLEQLERNGVSVCTFRGAADWEELSRLLSVEHLSHPFLYGHGSRRQEEDAVMRTDFYRLVPRPSFKGYYSLFFSFFLFFISRK